MQGAVMDEGAFPALELRGDLQVVDLEDRGCCGAHLSRPSAQVVTRAAMMFTASTVMMMNSAG